jgi:prepilin-type N-terminal cleavage/methylation domain-containing protein
VTSRRVHSRPNERGESGFTLVELLIAVVILGIIAGVVTTTFVVLTRTSQQTQDRLNQSRGPKFASVYWMPDVASSDAVNPVGVRCGTTGTPIVTFRWADDRAAQDQVATWATIPRSSSIDLVRMQCSAGSLGVPARTTVIAPDVAPAGIQVRCDAGTGLTSCSSPMTPRRVVLDVTTLDGRSFTVDANRRVS